MKDHQYFVQIGNVKMYKVVAPNAWQARTKGARMYVKANPNSRLGSASDVIHKYRVSVKKIM